jgi:hypothetical protein
MVPCIEYPLFVLGDKSIIEVGEAAEVVMISPHCGVGGGVGIGTSQLNIASKSIMLHGLTGGGSGGGQIPSVK